MYVVLMGVADAGLGYDVIVSFTAPKVVKVLHSCDDGDLENPHWVNDKDSP